MEEIVFVVESTRGDMEVRLLRDGWTRLEFQEPDEGAVIVEDIVRNDKDLAQSMRTLGLPEDEAEELAQELWDELDDDERAERAGIAGPRRDTPPE